MLTTEKTAIIDALQGLLAVWTIDKVCYGAYALNAEGEDYPPESDQAVRWDLIGAIRRFVQSSQVERVKAALCGGTGEMRRGAEGELIAYYDEQGYACSRQLIEQTLQRLLKEVV